MAENYDFFEELYEEIIDEINNTPLTTSRLSDYSNIININENIVNTVLNIRRYLEINDDSINYTPTNVRDTTIWGYEQDEFIDYNVDNSNIYLNTQPNIINSINSINSIFYILLDNTLNVSDYFNHDLEDVKVTLTQDDFNKLNEIKVSKENYENYKRECNICMDDYKIDDLVIEVPCKHVFHKECIENWLCKEKISCPICRTDCRNIS
jgi:hypothetical protein